MPSWKAVQSKKQSAKKTKFALIIIVSLLGFLILGNVIKFTQTLFKPWRTQIQRRYFWNGDFNINVLVVANGVSLLSLTPQNQKITIFDIPPQFYLEVSNGFGKWELRSVIGLGGDKLLKDSLSNQFGLPIDGFLDFSSKMSQKKPNQIISEIKNNPLALIDILPDLKTDLTPFELLKFKMAISEVRFDKISQIDLVKTNVLDKEKLADGTEVLTTDPTRLDSILSEMADPAVTREHKTIAIFNSTNYPQLAQKAARLIANIGGNVIITSNGQNKLKTTQVLGEKSKTLQRLRQIFSSSDTIDQNLEEQASSRAQINIFLGEDYFNR